MEEASFVESKTAIQREDYYLRNTAFSNIESTEKNYVFSLSYSTYSPDSPDIYVCLFNYCFVLSLRNFVFFCHSHVFFIRIKSFENHLLVVF